MAKKRTPGITLTDRVSGKTAALNDPQAVRAVLIAVLDRIENDRGAFDSTDATDAIVLEICDKARTPAAARKLITDAATIQRIFKGTSIEGEVNETPSNAASDPAQVPLPRGRDLEKVLEDLGEVVGELWPILCSRIEKSEGEISQTITPRITWNPPTENRDGYLGVSASMAIQGSKITRTGAVSKKRGGGFQFSLFEPVSE